MTLYSSGLRLSEAAHLRVSDIDSKAMRSLSRVFRGKFLDEVRKMARQGEPIFPRRLNPADEPSAYQCWLDELYAAPWVVYSKPPFGGAERGLLYLERYTHRVAISRSATCRSRASC